jgi:hypothetical protein
MNRLKPKILYEQEQQIRGTLAFRMQKYVYNVGMYTEIGN